MTGSPLDEAVAAAHRGWLVVFPTDTVYGIAADPRRPGATDRLFEAKRRPRELTLPVLVSSTAEAERVAVFDDRSRAFARELWPGPLTLVLPRARDAMGFELGGDPATIGVRVPAHPLALELLARTGPLATTSANRSGEPPAATCEELVEVFADQVEIYLCQDEPLAGAASTVVDLAHGEARILRAGDVDPGVIGRLSGGEGPLIDSGPS